MNTAQRQRLLSLPCALLYFSERNWTFTKVDWLFGLLRSCTPSPESWVGAAHCHWESWGTSLSHWHHLYVKPLKLFLGSHYVHCDDDCGTCTPSHTKLLFTQRPLSIQDRVVSIFPFVFILKLHGQRSVPLVEDSSRRKPEQNSDKGCNTYMDSNCIKIC